MDIKELKKALETDEGKEIIASLIEESTKGLKIKNADLLEKLRKKDESVNELEKRLEKIEQDKEAAETAAAAKSGDIEKVKEQLEIKHKKELEKLLGEKSTLANQLNTHVIGEGLTQALVKAKVSPALMDAAKALITSRFKGEVGDNDGKPFAKFDGKAVDEFVTNWVQSDGGKAFVLADSNSGGGSHGANGNGKAGAGGTKSMKRSEFDALPANDKVKMAKEGVALVD